MDDAGNDSDTETCMVVEIQENELGEIMLVERPREQVFADDNRFCVVDCKMEPSDEGEELIEDVQENIEIVYLPDYDNPRNGPVLLKQELALHRDEDETEGSDGYESSPPPAPPTPPRAYRRGQKRTLAQAASDGDGPTSLRRETRLRSNPNVILKHQGGFHPRDSSWTLKLDAKDFAQTKTISSVTTIHTNPKSTTRIDGSENKTVPESRLIGKDVENPRPSILPHKCKYCDRAFRQSVSLQIHSTLHSQSITDGCHVS